MAYKLDLLVTFQVHPIFHVSCLNKVIDDKLLVQTLWTKLDEEVIIIVEPEAVTETRI